MPKQSPYLSFPTALFTAFFSVLIVAGTALAQGRAAAVFVDTVDRREIKDTQSVIGRLAATNRSDIATRVAGVVDTVTFRVGDRVAKGHALIKLDAQRFQIEKRAAEAAIAAAEAGMSVARAKLVLAEQTFNRQASLKSSTAFSRSRFDDLKQAATQSRSELSEAEARLQSAKVGLERAEYELRHITVNAPFAGVVIARQAQPGQYLQAGGQVATLLDIDDVEIAADVPGHIAASLQPGARIGAVFDDKTTLQVVVRAAIPVQNTSTRTRLVRFKLATGTLPVSRIAIGDTVVLQVPVSAARSVTTVPKDALLRGRDGWMVFVIDADKAAPRPVKLGQAVGERMEVTSGLQGGEIVVVRGNERLRPGQAVKPQHVAKPAPKQG